MAKGITVFVANYQLSPAGIQFLVGFTTLLMVLRFVLDAYRYRSNSVTMRSTLLTLDGMTNALLLYSLGVMQRPSMANSYYQVWAVLLVTLRYSVKHGRPAGIALRQTPLVDLMSSFWAANILRSRAPSMLKAPVWCLWTINSARIIHGFVSMEHATTSHKDNMRLVTEYMRQEHDQKPSVAADPATMAGYRYLVRGEDKQEKVVRHPGYRLELKFTRQEKLVTLEKVWEWARDNQQADQLTEGSTAGSATGEQEHQKRVCALLNSHNGKLKDLCLSFALYKLLRRRFYNLPNHESKLVKTKRLIFDSILGQESENKKADPNRAFRITKAEISFLNDFFYSRHALIFAKGFPFIRLLLSTLLVGAIMYMTIAIQKYSKIAKLDELGRVPYGVVFTWILLGMLGLKEVIEVAGYVFSDWTKVLLVCHYATQPWWLRGWVMEKVVRLLCRCSFIVKNWHGKMGQYNIIFGRLRPRLVTEEVQEAVLHSMGSLRNPSEESYLDNAFKDVPLLAAEKVRAKVNALEGDVHRILVWHIATCYCELHLAVEKKIGLESVLGDIKNPYLTAISLSQYCAHVLTLNPPLIPGNEILNGEVLKKVIQETEGTLWKCNSIPCVFEKLQRLTQLQNDDRSSDITYYCYMNFRFFCWNCPHGEESPEKMEDEADKNTLLKMGSELGQILIDEILNKHETDGNLKVLWEFLEKLWAGFLIHLAQSTRASHHKLHLRTGGELITHVWALLSHAGLMGDIAHGEMGNDSTPDQDAQGLVIDSRA